MNVRLVFFYCLLLDGKDVFNCSLTDWPRMRVLADPPSSSGPICPQIRLLSSPSRPACGPV